MSWCVLYSGKYTQKSLRLALQSSLLYDRRYSCIFASHSLVLLSRRVLNCFTLFLSAKSPVQFSKIASNTLRNETQTCLCVSDGRKVQGKEKQKRGLVARRSCRQSNHKKFGRQILQEESCCEGENFLLLYSDSEQEWSFQ